MKGLAGGLITRSDAAMAFMSQFDNVLPIWGIQRMAELEEWLAFMDETPTYTGELAAFVEREQAEFRRVNGLSEKDAIPSQLRSQWNRIGKAEDVKRLTNRRQRDIFERYFTEIAGIYRDVIIIANNAQDSAGLINREFEGQIRELAQRMTLSQAVKRAECVSVARRRLAGNVSPSLVFEALFCSLICF